MMQEDFMGRAVLLYICHRVLYFTLLLTTAHFIRGNTAHQSKEMPRTSA